MPLPANTNEWQHLRSQIETIHNRRVRKYFYNQPDDDISTPKSSLKHACVIKNNDSAAIVQLRQWLFEITAGHAASLQAPIYGIPIQEYQRDVKFKPQVRLFFSSDRGLQEDTESSINSRPVVGQIAFRLMDKESDTIRRTDAEALARDIKQALATPPVVWRKGWFKNTYFDPERGFDFRLMSRTQEDGKAIIRSVLDCRSAPFDEDFYQFVDHDKNYPANPGTHRVYGNTVQKPVKRPRIDVKFRYAQLAIWGRPKPVNLVDTTGGLQSVIERV